MAKLEDLKRGALVTRLLPGDPVTVVGVDWAGADVIDLTYRTAEGRLGGMLVYRDAEARFQVSEPGQAWSFNEDGGILRLALEAYRIRLAHLFDPLLAVHTSVVDPLPHQITAVYEEMLPRQPLRFLLADDPGAGKTIMAGLLIKELMVRGDARRCLVCCAGNLVDQWQDELWRRFQLDFKILSNQSVAEARTGNPFAEEPFLITRLDHLSRNEELQGKIGQCEWDLVVVYEAHKMSAHYYGQEVQILVATDAAGEGMHIQRAHLMINYDLPWNPNRLEQRFGRIQRIDPTQVCHMWNLVARETREGEVFARLLDNLEAERAAGPAPHLDYRPLDGGETRLVTSALEQQAWLRHDLEPGRPGAAAS